MLKKYFYIIILLFTAVNALADPDGSYGNLLLLGRSPKTVSSQQGDSIMRKVIEQADKYKTVVSRYEAEIYIKGKTEILKQNILMRFAHHLFPVDRKNKDMIFEMVSHSEQLPAQLRSDKRKQYPQRRKTAGSLDISEPERLFANHLQRRDHHASSS